jgi:hypothetical protein
MRGYKNADHASQPRFAKRSSGQDQHIPVIRGYFPFCITPGCSTPRSDGVGWRATPSARDEAAENRHASA